MPRKKKDEIGDSFPNDYLEVIILFVCGVGIFGGVLSLYYLVQQLN